MENLKISGVKDVYFKPSVDFNAQTGILNISGESYLEDTRAFYLPLIRWVEQYTGTKPDNVIMNIDLSYYNTSTSKHLLELFFILKEYKSKGGTASINWHYTSDDADIEEEIEDFQLETGLKINLVAKN